MGDLEIDLAGELASFNQHRVARPFDEVRPHFADENERRVVKVPHLEKLPDERKLKQRADATGSNNERIGDDHEMVQPRKERAVFERLGDKRIDLLFERQLNINADRAAAVFWI